MDQMKFTMGRFKGKTYQEAYDMEDDYSKFLLEIILEDKVTYEPFKKYIEYVKSLDIKAV